ncbi:MAG TPA: paraquat-inducible protein A [Bacteroidia bacterium]|nr:paraquat-inducible protein A [Bacteroidia bacterium]
MKAKIQKYTLKEKILRIVFILVILPFAGFAGWCGYTIYNLSAERAVLKKDYSDVNNIQHGLLSVNKWRDNITEIVNTQIDEFEFSGDQQDTLKREVNKILNALITQAEDMINEKQKSVGGKLKKFAFKTFVNVDKVRERVPEFSQTIIDQVKKPRSKARLKYLAQDKLNDFAAQTRDSILESSSYDRILSNYKVADVNEFNKIISERADNLQEQSYRYTYIMLGVMVFFLLLWLVLRKAAVLNTPLFTISVILALIFLFTGLAAPMIEIDARIQEINFLLIGKNILFYDQVLFYQSKSIIDVVKILIETGKADSVLVGLLILIFSIVFPVAKLLSTKFFLLGSEKWRNSKIIKFFAFKSGKWSMADVMVVAIFMAYIGFKGILDSELGKMSTDMNNENMASIATNKTSLQPGFILFIAFVLFSLILSVILKRISPDKNKLVENTEIEKIN